MRTRNNDALLLERHEMRAGAAARRDEVLRRSAEDLVQHLGEPIQLRELLHHRVVLRQPIPLPRSSSSALAVLYVTDKEHTCKTHHFPTSSRLEVFQCAAAFGDREAAPHSEA